jgi:hypothetical protein
VTGTGHRYALFLTRAYSRLLCTGMAELADTHPDAPAPLRRAAAAYDAAVGGLARDTGLGSLGLKPMHAPATPQAALPSRTRVAAPGVPVEATTVHRMTEHTVAHVDKAGAGLPSGRRLYVVAAVLTTEGSHGHITAALTAMQEAALPLHYRTMLAASALVAVRYG